MTNVTPEYVTEIIQKFEVADENKQKGVMGIEGNNTTHSFTLSFFFSKHPFVIQPRLLFSGFVDSNLHIKYQYLVLRNSHYSKK